MIEITAEMRRATRNETNRRNPDKNPHFVKQGMDIHQNHELGFIGEFCFCELAVYTSRF